MNNEHLYIRYNNEYIFPIIFHLQGAFVFTRIHFILYGQVTSSAKILWMVKSNYLWSTHQANKIPILNKTPTQGNTPHHSICLYQNIPVHQATVNKHMTAPSPNTIIYTHSHNRRRVAGRAQSWSRHMCEIWYPLGSNVMWDAYWVKVLRGLCDKVWVGCVLGAFCSCCECIVTKVTWQYDTVSSYHTVSY